MGDEWEWGPGLGILTNSQGFLYKKAELGRERGKERQPSARRHHKRDLLIGSPPATSCLHIWAFTSRPRHWRLLKWRAPQQRKIRGSAWRLYKGRLRGRSMVTVSPSLSAHSLQQHPTHATRAELLPLVYRSILPSSSMQLRNMEPSCQDYPKFHQDCCDLKGEAALGSPDPQTREDHLAEEGKRSIFIIYLFFIVFLHAGGFDVFFY